MKTTYWLIVLAIMLSIPFGLAAQLAGRSLTPDPSREEVLVSIKEELQLTVDIYKKQVEILNMIMDLQQLNLKESNLELSKQLESLRQLKLYEGKNDEKLIASLQAQLDINKKELTNADLNLEQMNSKIKQTEAKINEYYREINNSAELLIGQVEKDTNPQLPASILSSMKFNYKNMAAATAERGMDQKAFEAFQQAANEYLTYVNPKTGNQQKIKTEIQLRNENFASAQANQMQYEQLQVYVMAFSTMLDNEMKDKEELQKRLDEIKALPFGKTYQDKIYFESGSVELSPEALKILSEFAASVPPTDDYEVLITGFCDNTPIGAKLKKKYASNWELSLARSSAVVRYMLETLKFPPEKIIIAGKGEFETKNTDLTQDKQQSRRVEFRFVPKNKK